ncbi:hypothetical protein COV19_04025 [Candidatus Woesearchaeota archaeon CG10_big_fil_rev_8_21_14_0_10_44_13]|nr:MAG: hypothetical protein COV19_04025 [Candidatus Woesearchaeota archaeon CG10_big_fil_rev_8_21_14_0_10_44_13]
MDKKDKKIIYELDFDSRQTLSQIGRKVGLSEQLVSYRINNLVKDGIITAFFAVIDIARMGYTSYKVVVQLTNTDRKKFDEIIAHLSRHPDILWLASCGSRWDLTFNIMARNIIEFSNIFNSIKLKFPGQIQNYNILITMEAFHYGRKYLSDKKEDIVRVPYFGKEAEIAKLDKHDLKILDILSENSRLNLLEISKNTNLAANTISNRVKNLKKAGVIQTFKPLVHVEKIGYQTYKLLIKLHNITSEKENKIKAFANQHENIVFLIRLVGPWDMELEVEVENREKLQQIVMELRNIFPEIIKEIETMPIYHDYRYNYFPKELAR